MNLKVAVNFIVLRDTKTVIHIILLFAVLRHYGEAHGRNFIFSAQILPHLDIMPEVQGRNVSYHQNFSQSWSRTNSLVKLVNIGYKPGKF